MTKYIIYHLVLGVERNERKIIDTFLHEYKSWAEERYEKICGNYPDEYFELVEETHDEKVIRFTKDRVIDLSLRQNRAIIQQHVPPDN